MLLYHGRMMAAGNAFLRGCVLAALLAPASPAARAADCVAWSGEPRPLPRVVDSDPQRARWAQLRAIELARLAQELEPSTPVTAHQLWRRLLCLDPKDEGAQAGVLRTQPLRLHRPTVSFASEPSPLKVDTD